MVARVVPGSDGVQDGEQAAAGGAESDAGCQVDWSWLEGREIAVATSTLDKLVITFRDGETLTVQAALWKGQAFLGFNPWKPRS